MKRFLIALVVASMPLMAMALEVWTSSQTNVAAASQKLCSGYRAVLHGVCVSSATQAQVTSNIQLSNSSWTVSAFPTTGLIDTRAVGCQVFDVIYSTGIFYTKTGTSNVNILYNCY